MMASIHRNIVAHGYHVTLVQGGSCPRFAYTIGRWPRAPELVLAGATFTSNGEVGAVLHGIVNDAGQAAEVDLATLGRFTLRDIHASWIPNLLLGAVDVHGTSHIRALQVVPEARHYTHDTPDMARPLGHDPVWRWLTEPWTWDVPAGATAVTHLAALRGEAVTEACRWEEGCWELFAGAGPDMPPDEVREVPLGTLLALDPSLEHVVGLAIGEGAWRERRDAPWNPWTKREP